MQFYNRTKGLHTVYLITVSHHVWQITRKRQIWWKMLNISFLSSFCDFCSADTEENSKIYLQIRRSDCHLGWRIGPTKHASICQIWSAVTEEMSKYISGSVVRANTFVEGVTQNTKLTWTLRTDEELFSETAVGCTASWFVNIPDEELFSETAVGCTASCFVKIIWCSLWFCNPPLFWGCILFYFRSPKGGCCSISDGLSCSCKFTLISFAGWSR